MKTLNATQRRLLAMAARGDLRCHMTCIRTARRGDDILTMITDPSRADADYRWYPTRLPRRAERHIKPLLDAGLLGEPIPQYLGYQRGRYIITDAGWAAHRRYPENESPDTRSPDTITRKEAS